MATFNVSGSTITKTYANRTVSVLKVSIFNAGTTYNQTSFTDWATGIVCEQINENTTTGAIVHSTLISWVDIDFSTLGQASTTSSSTSNSTNSTSTNTSSNNDTSPSNPSGTSSSSIPNGLNIPGYPIVSLFIITIGCVLCILKRKY